MKKKNNKFLPKGKKTLAVDLDGTIAKINPLAGITIGSPIKEAIPILKKFKRAGWQIILYTVRPDEWVLRKWCDKNFPKIFDAINCNPEDVRQWGIVSAKPKATIYLDDCAWPNNGFFDWKKFKEDAIKNKWIK